MKSENPMLEKTISSHPPSLPVTGPRGDPLLGSMRALRRDPLRFAMGLAEEHGPVAKFNMGPLTLYMVNHPEGVQRVLQENNHNYSKDSPIFAMMRPLLGNGLFLSEGDFWLRQRRLMQPMFHNRRIAGFGAIMVDAAEKTLASWREPARSGKALDISAEMMRLTLDVACRSLFSENMLDEAAEIGQSVSFAIEDATFRFDHPFYPPFQVPTLRNRRYMQAMASLDRVVYGMIAARRAQVDKPNDLLTLLLEARDETTGEGMSDKQLRDELVTLLIAGHETTANALTWALYILSTHPEIERRVYEEVSSVCGSSAPGLETLRQLTYTQRVIDETLRLYPPAWITNRIALDQDVVCAYRIPKGGVVSVSPYVTHRLPEFWDNPEGFDPDRFLPERAKNRPAFAYFPFGGGPRLCIGKSFALMEAPLVLAMIVQQCQVELLPAREIRKKPVATLRPADGMPMVVRFRD